MFTTLTLAMTLTGAVPVEQPKAEISHPAIIQVAANTPRKFGNGNISSGGRERRIGKAFDNGGRGIFGANLAAPPAAIGNGKGSNGGNNGFANGKGSNGGNAGFANGVGSNGGNAGFANGVGSNVPTGYKTGVPAPTGYATGAPQGYPTGQGNNANPTGQQGYSTGQPPKGYTGQGQQGSGGGQGAQGQGHNGGGQNGGNQNGGNNGGAQNGGGGNNGAAQNGGQLNNPQQILDQVNENKNNKS